MNDTAVTLQARPVDGTEWTEPFVLLYGQELTLPDPTVLRIYAEHGSNGA